MNPVRAISEAGQQATAEIGRNFMSAYSQARDQNSELTKLKVQETQSNLDLNKLRIDDMQRGIDERAAWLKETGGDPWKMANTPFTGTSQWAEQQVWNQQRMAADTALVKQGITDANDFKKQVVALQDPANRSKMMDLLVKNGGMVTPEMWNGLAAIQSAEDAATTAKIEAGRQAGHDITDVQEGGKRIVRDYGVRAPRTSTGKDAAGVNILKQADEFRNLADETDDPTLSKRYSDYADTLENMAKHMGQFAPVQGYSTTSTKVTTDSYGNPVTNRTETVKSPLSVAPQSKQTTTEVPRFDSEASARSSGAKAGDIIYIEGIGKVRLH